MRLMRITRKEAALLALPVLVPVLIAAARLVPRPARATSLEAVDIVGTYRAKTSEGGQIVELEATGNVRAVLVLHDGMTCKQDTGKWRLMKTQNGQQQVFLDGLLSNYNGHLQTIGGAYSIEASNGKVTIRSADGDFEKQF